MTAAASAATGEHINVSTGTSVHAGVLRIGVPEA